MLAEGFVALIALAVIMIMSPEEVTGMKPGTIYGRGIGNFLTILIGKEHLPFAITFGAMAFSTFVFDTLDVSTRLGRYIFQELTGLQGKLGAVVGTLITISVPTYILLVTGEGMWTRFWVLFGSANQLLAALTLLSITLWLYRNKKRIAYTLLPMLFVLTITLWSLIRIIMSSLDSSTGLDVFLFNAFAASLLILLAIFLVIRALYSWRKIV
jgi:carbon starvation protein